jgi:hypothetical protein
VSEAIGVAVTNAMRKDLVPCAGGCCGVWFEVGRVPEGGKCRLCCALDQRLAGLVAAVETLTEAVGALRAEVERLGVVER